MLFYDGTNWADIGAGGSGGVTGPGSSTDRAIATWNGTGGTTLRDNANATIDSSGNLAVVGLTFTGALIAKTRVHTAAGAVTVAADDCIIVVNKTSGAATTVNLPSSPATGRVVVIKDGKADANTNNITLTPASGNIDGAATFVINVNRASITCVYNGSEWSII